MTMQPNKPKIEFVKTADLIPYARNAKRHDDAQVAKLAGSIREYGFTNPVLIDASNGIIAGHGRVLGAQKLGMEDVPCIRLSHLTETQKRAYVLADNRLAEIGGGWDPDTLRIEVDELRVAGVDLDGIGFDASALAELLDASKDDSESSALSDDYTHKVDAPVYEPKGERPPIAELTDTTRARELIDAINAATIPDEIKGFLRQAAARHVVFDYGKIAEFYCHTDKPTQLLMEDSALVIIDFKKAMQLGYVKLKAEIADALESEQDNAEDDSDE